MLTKWISFSGWKKKNAKLLKDLEKDFKPRQIITQISEDLLKSYTGKDLIDKYDVYQHLMTYWNDIMQDDCYLIAADGWKAELTNINKGKKEIILDSDLVPKTLVIDRYFESDKKAIEELESKKEQVAAQLEELTEEHSAEDGYFSRLDKLSKPNALKRLKEIKGNKANNEEIAVLESYLKLSEQLTSIKKEIDEVTFELDKKAVARYKTFTPDDVKTLVVDDKWMTRIEKNIKTEMDRVSQALSHRIEELGRRYEMPLPQVIEKVATSEKRVLAHLAKMGFEWK